jgi:hypothetical protein
MKIGIVTHWDSKDNYGQQLQLFALQEFLRKLGHNPFLIRYDRSKDIGKRNYLNLFNPFKVWEYLMKSRNKRKSLKYSALQPSRHFDSFRKKYTEESDVIYNYNTIRENPPHADVYITGSDQVWRSVCPAEFLQFGDDDIIRVSYAASFGLSKFPKKSMKTKQQYLKKFNYISVRENDGLFLCKKMGFSNAQIVLDPTMLLDRDYYIKRFSLNQSSNNEDYLVLYLLGDLKGICVDEIYNFAEENNLKVRYVDTHGQYNEKEKIYPTIEEWLNLILNAKFVITNSFHGTVFSLLLHVKFCSIKKGSSDGRLYTLLERFKLEKNIYSNSLQCCYNNDINWFFVEEVISKEKKESITFLKKVLGEN